MDQNQSKEDVRANGIKHLTNLNYLTTSQVTELESVIFKKVEKDALSRSNFQEDQKFLKLFKSFYMNMLIHLLVNMDPDEYIKNTYLKPAILNGTVKVGDLPEMNAVKLFPENWKDYQIKEEAEITQITEGDLSAESMLYTCSKCKHNITNVNEKQTRSGDEGSTLTITCKSCSNTWRIYN